MARQCADSNPYNSDKENASRSSGEDGEGSPRPAKKEFSLQDLRKSFNKKNLQLDPLLTMHFEEVDRLERTAEHEPVEAGPVNLLESSPKRIIRRTTRLHSIRDSRGNKYLNQYIIIKDLGKGTYGKVKLCLNTQDSQLYAIKVIDKVLLKRRSIGRSSQGLQGVMREIAILKKMNHPNIVALHEVIDDRNHNKLYMVLEYVQGGPIIAFSAHQMAPPLAESVVWLYFRDICKGLDYLHHHKVIHRDLKPENLLRATDGTVKISDFGVSDVFDKTDTTTRTAGTPAFLAPEACAAGQFRGRDIDIWALGVCLFVMLFGCIPFQAATVHEMYDRIRNNPLVFPDAPVVSDEAKDLLRAILTKNPALRITLPSVMVHPWVTHGGQIPLPALIVQTDGHTSASLQVSEYEVSHAFADAGIMHLFDPVFTERTYEPGEYIIRQGEEGEDMFFINSGECEVLLQQTHRADDDFDARHILSSATPSRTSSNPRSERESLNRSRGSSSRRSKGSVSGRSERISDDISEDEISHLNDPPAEARATNNGTQGTETGLDRLGESSPLRQLLDAQSSGGAERYVVEESVIALRLPGQFVGEMAVFGGSSSPSVRTASVRARTQTRVLVVSKSEVSKVLANNKDAEDAIRNEIARRRRETTEALAWRQSSNSANSLGSTPPNRPSNDGSSPSPNPATPYGSMPPSPLGGSHRHWNEVEGIPEGGEDELLHNKEEAAVAKNPSPSGLIGTRNAHDTSLVLDGVMESMSHAPLLGPRGEDISLPGTPTGFNAMSWEKHWMSERHFGERGPVAEKSDDGDSAAPSPVLRRDITLAQLCAEE